MDFADKLDFMDDDCDIEGFPLGSPCDYCPDYFCPATVMADCPDAPRPYV